MDSSQPYVNPVTLLPNLSPEEREIWVRWEGPEGEDPVHRPADNPEQLKKIREELLALNTANQLPEKDQGEAGRVPEKQCLPSSQTGPPVRKAHIHRDTAETQIRLSLNLDGAGQANLNTGIGFFEHMLTLLARHSLFDLTIEAKGDLYVDAHHTVEDVGICLGKALVQGLGDKAGIRRYGSATLPMDETLVTAAVDLSGRPFCVWQAEIPPEILGTFNAPLAEEFWRAVANTGLMNLHVVCHHGKNTHHIVEGIFKACARALRQAVEMDPRMPGIPSTKGVL